MLYGSTAVFFFFLFGTSVLLLNCFWGGYVIDLGCCVHSMAASAPYFLKCLWLEAQNSLTLFNRMMTGSQEVMGHRLSGVDWCLCKVEGQEVCTKLP